MERGGHTQHIIKEEEINKAKHTYLKPAYLLHLFSRFTSHLHLLTQQEEESCILQKKAKTYIISA